MRRVDIAPIIGRVQDTAVREALREIELASAESNITDMTSPFIVEPGYTVTRELEVGVSTLAETQAFIATLIDDYKRGGATRSL